MLVVQGITCTCFSCGALMAQAVAIYLNTPGIDQLKGIKGESISPWVSCCRTFGEDSVSWRWFVPVYVSPHVTREFGRLLAETAL